jgi:phage repressor protein C with HTH and peptisase S24 domain
MYFYMTVKPIYTTTQQLGSCNLTCMSDLTNRIEERLKAVGLTANAASVQATGSPSTIPNILLGRSKNPRTDTVEKIALVLKCRPAWLITGELPIEADLDPPSPDPDALGLDLISEFRDAGIEMKSVRQLPKDVPVLGTVAASELGKGAFQFTSEVIDYVRRPFGLLGARDIYALYVEGESMIPKFEPGDLVFVHPSRKPRGGDYVVIQEPDTDNGGPRGYIKRLKSVTATMVRTQQFNPPTNIDFIIRGGLVVHKVLSEGELYGI